MTIPSAQAFVSLLFEDEKARAIAFGVWGATGSTGFVYVNFRIDNCSALSLLTAASGKSPYLLSVLCSPRSVVRNRPE